MEDERPPALTQKELEQLAKATISGRGDGRASRAHLEQVAEWAIGTRAEAAMLALLLEGRATVHVREDGELVFAPAK